MKYLSWTYVDAQTGIPCLIAPTRNGPANPAVKGLAFGFALESRYPTAYPVFYGTCDDDAETDIPGVLAVIDQAGYDQALAGFVERITLDLGSRAWEIHYKLNTGVKLASPRGFEPRLSP